MKHIKKMPNCTIFCPGDLVYLFHNMTLGKPMRVFFLNTQINNFMRKAVLLFTLLAVSLQLSAQVIPYQELSRPEQKPGTDLKIYFETPHDLIIVDNGRISHESKNYHKSQPGGYSAQPVRYSAQTVVEGIPLNGNQLLDLKNSVENSGLLRLERHAFGAPAQQEGEDHFIRVTIDGQQRNFVFRSNSRFPNPPGAFDQMSQYLWWLVTEVER